MQCTAAPLQLQICRSWSKQEKKLNKKKRVNVAQHFARYVVACVCSSDDYYFCLSRTKVEECRAPSLYRGGGVVVWVQKTILTAKRAWKVGTAVPYYWINSTKDMHRLKSLSLVSECQCHKFCSVSPSICLCLHNEWMVCTLCIVCTDEHRGRRRRWTCIYVPSLTSFDRSFVRLVAVFVCLFWCIVMWKCLPGRSAVHSNVCDAMRRCSCWMSFNRATAVCAVRTRSRIYKITKNVQTADDKLHADHKIEHRTWTRSRAPPYDIGEHVKWHLQTMKAPSDRHICLCIVHLVEAHECNFALKFTRAAHAWPHGMR